MPFITEELWAITAERSGIERSDAADPRALAEGRPAGRHGAADEINFVVDLIATVRSVRVGVQRAGGGRRPMSSSSARSRAQEGWLAAHDAAIRRLARASALRCRDVAPPNSAQSVVGDVVVCLPLDGLVDLDAERARLAKELKRARERTSPRSTGASPTPSSWKRPTRTPSTSNARSAATPRLGCEKLQAAIGRLSRSVWMAGMRTASRTHNQAGPPRPTPHNARFVSDSGGAACSTGSRRGRASGSSISAAATAR